jgi:hypothetical protein
MDLLRSLAGGWGAWADLARGAFGPVRAMVISGHTWRRAARVVWPAVESCPLYVQRRPSALLHHILIAVDSFRTQAALAGRLEPLAGRPGLRITVAYASVPAWASGLSAALGYPAFVERPGRGALPLAAAGARGDWRVPPDDAACAPSGVWPRTCDPTSS